MAISHTYMIHPHKRQRRTATSVLAGEHEPRLAGHVLTSLNGIGPYALVEPELAQAYKLDIKERKERERESKKRVKAALRQKKSSAALKEFDATPVASASRITETSSMDNPLFAPKPTTGGGFWGRPNINLSLQQRSESVTPPPMDPSSPPTTPGPSISSSTSRTSSKRPRTPDDDEDLDLTYARLRRGSKHSQSAYTSRDQKQREEKEKTRKKKAAPRKGWKGWVEASPPPSDKLISIVVIQERKTRSGRTLGA